MRTWYTPPSTRWVGVVVKKRSNRQHPRWGSIDFALTYQVNTRSGAAVAMPGFSQSQFDQDRWHAFERFLHFGRSMIGQLREVGLRIYFLQPMWDLDRMD